MANRELLILSILTLIGFSYCGGASVKLGEPWRPEESPFFDDGVDLVKDLSSLSGEWAYRHKNWLEGRIQLADVVAIVEITSVQTKTDVDGREVKRIDVLVLESLYGTPANNPLSLESQEDAPGHELILRYERHLAGEFILFGRWFKEENPKDPGQEIGHHFHLSKVSEVMIAEVKRRIAKRKNEEGKSKTVETD